MKTIKRSEQNIKVEITQNCCKVRVINAFWQKFGGNSKKALENISREFLFCFYRRVRERAYHKYRACHLAS